jgi:bla regulator protein blaR1
MISPAFWNETWTNEGWTAALVNHLWQSTLVVLIAWLLTLTLRSNQARTRYWVLMIASVKFLIPFSLLIAAGESLRTAVTTPIQPPALAAVMQQIAQPFPQTTSAADHLYKAPLVPEHYANLLSAILVAVWLCGFLSIVFAWVRAWRLIWAAVRASSPMQIKLPANVPVLSSPRLLEPGVFGIVRPVLLLPENISDRLSAPQLCAIVSHELWHIRRRDNLTAAIHMLVAATFWFHPAVWWIRARLLEERERACDEAVLQSGNEAQVYAEGILSVCRFYVESPLECASGISGSDLKQRIARIMTQGFARRLTLGRKILLAAIGLAVTVLPIGFGLLNAIPSTAESQASKTASAHVYEVASIRPDKSGDPRFKIMSTADGFSANTTLQALIRLAYGVEDNQISGAPKWVNSDKYEVEAKMDGATTAELDKLSDDQSEPARERMLQALLEDRFKLMLHRETKELPVYSLIVAKNGPKLQQTKPGEPDGDGRTGPDGRPAVGGHFMRMGRGQLDGHSLGMADFVRLLTQQLGRTVVDKTGLRGNYNFTLKWTPDDSEPLGFKEPAGGQGSPPDSLGPSIFTAVQEQLGLKLESQKGPVEILVIDHVEKPSEN